MRDFVDWLAAFNRSRSDGDGRGFSAWTSTASTRRSKRFSLSGPRRPGRRGARACALRCFEYFGDSAQGYGFAVTHGADSCEDEAVAQLSDLRPGVGAATRWWTIGERRVLFRRTECALVMNAERYYRECFAAVNRRGTSGTPTWRKRSTRCASGCPLGAVWSCGRTTRTSAMRGPPRWAAAVKTISGNSRANATAAKLLDRLFDLRGYRHRGG